MKLTEAVTDQILLKPFMRDARKSLGFLEELFQNPNFENEDNLRKYTTTVHGMKSSLLIIGEEQLSESAYELELFGRHKNIPLIIKSTPEFLEKLRTLLERLENLETQTANESAAHSQAIIRLLEFDEKNNGLDIKKGLERYAGNAEAYSKILRSYAVSMRSMLPTIEIFRDDKIRDYKIAVHGIKGASFDIYADYIGESAANLEKAAKNDDFDYINKHNPEFVEVVKKLLDDLDMLLSVIAAETPKPRKDEPDSELLLKLRIACDDYDMDIADEAMTEIEKYQYDSDGGLANWLRENIDMMNFTEIVEKLSD